MGLQSTICIAITVTLSVLPGLSASAKGISSTGLSASSAAISVSSTLSVNPSVHSKRISSISIGRVLVTGSIAPCAPIDCVSKSREGASFASSGVKRPASISFARPCGLWSIYASLPSRYKYKRLSPI